MSRLGSASWLAPATLATFATFAFWVALSGCSSSDEQRDQHYGSDVGIDYVPPEAGAVLLRMDAGVDMSAVRDGGAAERADAPSER
jgi:hypothetical protein